MRNKSSNEHQRAYRTTQEAVNKVIRERDNGKTCISCGNLRKLEAGHFRVSTLYATRFHPRNINGQCAYCNRYNGGKTFEYGLNLDKKWGNGWANFLEKLSHTEGKWTTEEMKGLRDAAKRGHRVYEQYYFTLRPTHMKT
ncbi:MAG: recombination protein NinG [Patescibacteria group bacterium]|nr:recombination protein NinG [Patescibacteria group bacterium]